MNSKIRDWAIALGYVVLIYATLEVARVPLSFLRSHGWLRISLGILYGIVSLCILTKVVFHHTTSLWRYASLIVIGIVYFLTAKNVQTPEEQIHFFEYGLLGYFFLRALRNHNIKPLSQWLFAFLLASASGWLDEILQGITPNRHYDPKDVLLNIISSGLGLMITRTIQNKNHTDK
ncbi:MAG: hypothetical protein KCHDKBKB_01213 [Elusimicrobia bacterium]|nr:hypothetical protein [Elusimicrobiota bacterium]